MNIMESFFATIEDNKIVGINKPLFGKKKVLITLLEEEDTYKKDEEIPLKSMMELAATSGAFNFLFEEGEHEYSIKDLKVIYK